MNKNNNANIIFLLILGIPFRFFAEMLEMDSSPQLIRHSSIGLHFDRFDGQRYIPNAEKRARYPDDDAAAQALLNY